MPTQQPTTTPPNGYEWRQNASGNWQMFRIATSFGTGGNSQTGNSSGTTTPTSNLTNPNNAWTNQPSTPSTPTPSAPASNYTGVSIVDYLNSIGQSSSYSNRIQLANQYGITNYSGTATQNTQLLNMLRSGNNPTANLNIPQTASEIDATETQDSRVEGMTGNSALDTFLQSTLNVGLSQTDQAIQTLLSQLETNRAAQETAAQTRQDEAALGLRNAQEGESLEDIQRRLIEEFEINDIRKQLEQYKNQLIALNEEASMTDMAIKNKPINAAIIRGQRALSEESFAYKAATIQAKVAVAGEQYDLAAQTVNSLFSAAAQDRADTISYYERLYELERQNLITLNQEERENINAQISLVQAADQRARDNQDKLASLFADPVMAKAFQQSGASLSDDFAVTMQKMLPFINDENKRLELLSMSGKSGGGSGGGSSITSNSSSFNTAIKDAAKLLVNSRNAGDLTDAEYNSAISQLVDSNYNVESMTPEQLQDAFNQMSSLVNTAMEGKPLGQNVATNQTATPEQSIQEQPERVLNSWFTDLSDKTGFTKFATSPVFSSLFNTFGVYDRFGLNYDPKTNQFKLK